MELPLIERMHECTTVHFPPAAAQALTEGALCGSGSLRPGLRMPGAGEQHRFHFDMTMCIGCKCCEVACNEQNGNPADILWRRMGEKEGTYTNSERRVSKVNQAVRPPGEARPDFDSFLDFADKLGCREELFPRWQQPHRNLRR